MLKNGTIININAAAYLLAVKLDQFAKDFDPYGYADNVEDQAQAITGIARDLVDNHKEHIDGIKTYLKSIVEEENVYCNEAQSLLTEIAEFEKAYLE